MSELFLSHNRVDKPYVRGLYQELQQLGAGDIFLDEVSLDGGERLIPGLEKGLADTLVFVLVWSANAAKSKWVPLERERAIVQNVNGVTQYVFPVCLDDTPLPGFVSLYVSLDAQVLNVRQVAEKIMRSLDKARQARSTI